MDGKNKRGLRIAFDSGNRSATTRHRQLDRKAGRSLYGGIEFLLVDVGGHQDILDKSRRNDLQPNGLPDAGGGGIIDIVWIEHLLTMRTDALIGGVKYLDQDLIVLRV